MFPKEKGLPYLMHSYDTNFVQEMEKTWYFVSTNRKYLFYLSFVHKGEQSSAFLQD